MLVRPVIDIRGPFSPSQYLACVNDTRPSFGVFGVVFSDPHGGWGHTDTPRMHALQDSNRGVKVYGVSLTNSSDSPTGISADFRNPRSFPRVFGCVIGSLDYFFLPDEYFRSSRIGLGYGSSWFTTILPAFFQYGGSVFFLPNDKSGNLLRMRQDYNDAKLAVSLLSVGECWKHPLFQATTLLLQSPVWKKLIHQRFQCKTNESALEHYLDKSNPFLVVFKRTQFASLCDALAFVKIICISTGKIDP